MMHLHVARRMAAYLAAMGSLWMAWRFLCTAFRQPQSLTATVVAVVVFLALAAGLFCMNRFARRIAAALCLFAAIVVPVGYMNPFMAMDTEAAGHALPALTNILWWMVPLIIGLVALAWLLDPPKAKGKDQ